MTRRFVHETITIGDAARRELARARDSQPGPATTPYLDRLANESQQATDTFVSSGPIERIDGIPSGHPAHPEIDRLDGNGRAEEARRREAEDEARRAAKSAAGSVATEATVERVTGEPEHSR